MAKTRNTPSQATQNRNQSAAPEQTTQEPHRTMGDKTKSAVRSVGKGAKTAVGVAGLVAATAPLAAAKMTRDGMENVIDQIADEMNFDLEHAVHETRHHPIQHPQGDKMKAQRRLPYVSGCCGHDHDGPDY